MSKEVWAYVLCVLGYLIFAGPFLISAPSWIAVAAGVLSAVGLAWWGFSLMVRTGEGK